MYRDSLQASSGEVSVDVVCVVDVGEFRGSIRRKCLICCRFEVGIVQMDREKSVSRTTDVDNAGTECRRTTRF